jgi:large subunit ribosomal protein L11
MIHNRSLSSSKHWKTIPCVVAKSLITKYQRNPKCQNIKSLANQQAQVYHETEKLTGYIKLQLPAGEATPAPPVGPALGQHGVNIGQFVMQFNERTRHLNGMPVTAVVNVYQDKTFDFIVKSPPASVLLKDAAQVAKGSGTAKKEKVGKVTQAQVEAICKTKMPTSRP